MSPRSAKGARAVPRAGRSAAGIMFGGVPVFASAGLVRDLRRRLGEESYDIVDIVLLVDADGRYESAAPLRDVLQARDDALAGSLGRKDWPTVDPGLDQELAVARAADGGVACLPVVSADGRPLGCIPGVRLLSVLGREHREDVHRLVGMLREREGVRHALEDPPIRRVTHRLPWLLVGLALSTGGAALMAGFEHALKANIALAFFIPSLVYLTDAIGTQTEAIAVRGFSLQPHLRIGRLLGGELLTGGLIGLVLGLLAFIGVWAGFGDPRLALGVGISMVIAGTLASASGLVLPWFLARLGLDPAFGSGPVATIIQDLLTILVYFLVMSWLLPGT